MAQLPVELTTEIFSLACFDDKATGSALCLTSKQIMEITNDVRFEALSLYGQTQISGFASMLSHCPPQHVNLKHLFISGASLEEETKARAKRSAYAQELGIEPSFITTTALEEADDKEASTLEALVNVRAQQQAINEAYSQIMDHSGSGLKTLFIVSMFDSSPLLSLPRPLPKLTDLCVISSGGIFELQQCFPNLRRIHTTLPLRNWHATHDIDFTENAPALEELRLTDQDTDAEWFVLALTWHTGRGEPSGKDELSFPDTMRRVILQQCAPPYAAQCGYPWSQHEDFTGMMRDVALLFRESAKAKFELVVLPELDAELWARGKSNGLGYYFDDARMDWGNIVLGACKGRWDD